MGWIGSGAALALGVAMMGPLAGCDDTAGVDAADAAIADAALPDASDPTVSERRSVTIGPVTAAPGEEGTLCVVLDLGNTDAAMLRAIHTELSGGTHHVIVTRSIDPPSPELTPCGTFAGGAPDADLLFIAQQSEAMLAYPTGAGLPIAAHQSIHLEMHYLNAGTVAAEISGTAHLDLATVDAALAPVEMLFTGELSLFVPAGEEATVTSHHPLPPGGQLFATTAHTHQWGRHASVELLSPGSDARLLHESTDWAERPLSVVEPIALVGGEELRLTCSFDNESKEDVNFGLGANDEMCFVWAHIVTAP
jgi:hypothetical protein